MKKILFTALFLSGIALLTPNAEAGCKDRVFVGYDRCGRPVYQEVHTPSYYQARPTYYHNVPVRSHSHVYGRDYDYGRSYQSSPSRCYSSRPRFSISFGF